MARLVLKLSVATTIGETASTPNPAESVIVVMSPFWLLWMVFLVMFLIAPIGYGWGYRRWGIPYPSYVQRRLARLGSSVGSSFDHQAWGWTGNLVWLGLLIAFVWALSAFVWLR